MTKKGLMFSAVPALGFMGVFPMKGYRRLAAAILGVALLGVLLASCGSQSPTASPAQTATSAPTVGPTPTTPPEPTQLTTNQATTAPTAPTPTGPLDTPRQTEVPIPTATPVPTPQPIPTRLAETDSQLMMAPTPTAMPAAEAQSATLSGLSPRSTDSYVLSTGGTDTVNDAPYDATFFKHYGVNPFIDTEDDHLSTFAMDVDTASYTVMRRIIQDGYLPDPEAVRVEEFVNFFEHGYEPPKDDVFSIHIEGSPSPFGGNSHWLMRVGLQGHVIAAEERKDASLIFVIDVSGSMAREDRLGLVKRSLGLLVDELRPMDQVGIVVYGSQGRVLLEPTSGANKEAIMEAVNALSPDGATNAAEGLVLGYKMAVKEVQSERITRVILLSDGVANVGNTGSGSILNLIKGYVEEGVTLSTVGFGMGNYNDILMEQLANDGNGTYAYVDTLSEARRIFVENLTGTLQVIALDSKIQVDFNPEVVSRYRLLGYENRRVADQDFRNDAVDAGEVGAGHSVTALYELKLHEGESGSLATVFIRYQDPDTREVTELSRNFDRTQLRQRFEDSSPRFQLAAAVAEYAEILRESYWAQGGSLEDVLTVAERVQGLLVEDSDVAEFVGLVVQARLIGSRG
ncbi:MAG: von Willebrand factor type A domain-containing protein [Dehalococcoidia bacterium]|nr:von Willebrand factor type A domain-containing protein [Dehalococcoidia bacterium]